MVARRLLPASPSYLLDRHDRVITGARPRVVSRHVGRTRRRNHDGRATRTGSLVEDTVNLTSPGQNEAS